MAGNLTAMIASIFSGGVTPDPYFEYTTLLLPGNGTNGAQNNTFLDGSTNNFTITRNGNTTQGTFSPFSQTGWGNYFNGTSGYLTASDPGFVATGDFTVEAWVYGTLTGAYQGIFSSADATDTAGFRLGIINTNFLEFWLNGSVNSSTAYVFNQWNHIAMVRSGSSSNNVSCYFNGTRVAQFTNTSSTTNSLVALGRYRTGGTNQYWFGGYLSNARLVTGAALYSGATITVPTSPLSIAPSGTTQLLTCQSNRFVDNSSTPKTITINGTVTVQAFSPFNPTASWSAATNGGSGYFDGSGDYLSSPSSSSIVTGTNSLTIEAWFYWSGSSTKFQIFGSSSNDFNSYVDATSVNLYDGTTGTSRSTTIIKNQWNHFALVRNGSTATFYINGNAVGATFTWSKNYSSAFQVLVGRNWTSGTDYADGYISDFRILNGTAATITVPTAPLTAITNTSLLLNFTNAGIYDATSKNDLETVGNAQISTTQSKWGGSSMYFDGNGDYSTAPSTILEQFGTANFTIEFWFYKAANGAFNYGDSTGDFILRIGNAGFTTNSIVISTNNSQQITAFIGYNGSSWATTIVSSSTFSLNTWYYCALVRSGTGANQTALYVNGTSYGTATNSTNLTDASFGTVLRLGASGSDRYFNGYLQDFRITNGYARTVTTSPTAAFPTL